MKVGLHTGSNYQTLINAQKMLEAAARLPQKLAEDVLKLQGKLVRANTVLKLQSSKIDTYA